MLIVWIKGTHTYLSLTPVKRMAKVATALAMPDARIWTAQRAKKWDQRYQLLLHLEDLRPRFDAFATFANTIFCSIGWGTLVMLCKGFNFIVFMFSSPKWEMPEAKHGKTTQKKTHNHLKGTMFIIVSAGLSKNLSLPELNLALSDEVDFFASR